jgi:hypothetical protein
MHPILPPSRHWNVTIAMNVDNEGLRFEATLHHVSKEVTFSSWKMVKYPESFVDSAEAALSRKEVSPNEYQEMSEKGLVNGWFISDTGPKEEWIQLAFHNEGKSILVLLRRTEVANIVTIVRQYWNMELKKPVLADLQYRLI